MPAMEGQGNWSPIEELLQTHHLCARIGQHERRHRIADFRGCFAGANSPKPGDEQGYRASKFGTFPPYRLEKSAQLLLQR